MDTRAVVVLFSIVFALSNSHPLIGGKNPFVYMFTNSIPNIQFKQKLSSGPEITVFSYIIKFFIDFIIKIPIIF